MDYAWITRLHDETEKKATCAHNMASNYKGIYTFLMCHGLPPSQNVCNSTTKKLPVHTTISLRWKQKQVKYLSTIVPGITCTDGN
jgi:hypothetical protein